MSAATANVPEFRECQRCHAQFELLDPVRGRNRRLCVICSPPLTRSPVAEAISSSRPQPHSAPTFSSDIEAPPAPVHDPSRLEKIVERELNELQMLDSSEGELAIRMCRALDDPELTGTQIASLVKTLYAHLKMIREMAPEVDLEEEAAQAALVLKLNRRL